MALKRGGWAGVVAVAALLFGCSDDSTGAGGQGGGVAQPATAYDPTHVVEVAITMSEADWDALRFQGNDPIGLLGGDCLAGPRTANFDYFDGSVTLDGISYPKVALRKKGFLGSLSVSKPSLKIKLDEYDKSAKFGDADKLTLNNVKQDGALVRTCLAFEQFAAAGVPAPRCNFAHVTVNGADLGIYANVESVNKSMLERTFGDGSGNLYEGQMSDFRDQWVNTYEKKTNESDPSRADLTALTTALGTPDATLLDEVDPLLDVDAFLSFWAMEALLGSWDGYTNNQNNHLVYDDPKSGKLGFIPWSPDMTFVVDDPFQPKERPLSVSAGAAIPNRLYALPEIRDRYRKRVLELADKVMKPEPLLAEIDRMEALLTPYLAEDRVASFSESLTEVRDYSKTRAADVKAELAAGPAEWSYPTIETPCSDVFGSLSGSFTTESGTVAKENPFATGKGDLHVELMPMPMPYDTTVTGSAAGDYNDQYMLMVLGSDPEGQLHMVVLMLDKSVIAPGVDIPFDWQQAFGVFGDVVTGDFALKGTMVNGTIHFDKVGLNDGDPVVGHFSAEVM